MFFRVLHRTKDMHRRIFLKMTKVKRCVVQSCTKFSKKRRNLTGINIDSQNIFHFSLVHENAWIIKLLIN